MSIASIESNKLCDKSKCSRLSGTNFNEKLSRLLLLKLRLVNFLSGVKASASISVMAPSHIFIISMSTRLVKVSREIFFKSLFAFMIKCLRLARSRNMLGSSSGPIFAVSLNRLESYAKEIDLKANLNKFYAMKKMIDDWRN